MKRVLVWLALAALGGTPGFAQWAVIDAANLQQSAVNYAALVQQLSNQATQIANQVRQIQNFETQLKRMGDMANVKNIVGFPEFRADLNLPSKIQTWAEGLVRVDGRGLFGDTRGGIFRGVTPDYRDFDGVSVPRDAAIYKDAHDMTETVDEFKTEAEQKKLSAVLGAQYNQLASLDAEVELSAAQVQVKAAESTAMTNAQGEADAEARTRLAQEEAGKVTSTFVPQYECLLQYVTERRFSP
jgi:hypothetical protein